MKKVAKIIGVIWAVFWGIGCITMLSTSEVPMAIVFLVVALFGVIPSLIWKTDNEMRQLPKPEPKPKLTLDELLAEQGFQVDKSIEIPGGVVKKFRFLVDDKNKKFAIYNANGLRILPYKDLGDYELNEDGSSIVQGKGVATAVGALTFGVVGALVGSSGKRKNQNTCTSLVIRIMVNDLQDPQIIIPYISFEVKKNSILYKSSFENAKSLMVILSYITNQPLQSNI